MTRAAERLYALLPAIHRQRDEAAGGPLAALLAVIAEQVELLEAGLDQFYDDQFIETCASWVVPYLGDLVSHRPLHGTVSAAASPRAEVANALRLRRRKGTVAALAELARDVTGLDARIVESLRTLATAQYVNHVRADAPATVLVRGNQDRHQQGRGTPGSGDHPRIIEVRSPRQGGRHHPGTVGVLLWRLQSHPLTRMQAMPANDDPARRRWRFHPLGIDCPLFDRPRASANDPDRVPAGPITRRRLLREVMDLYGPGRSILLERPGATVADAPVAVPVEQIVACDLSDVRDANGNVTGWARSAPPGRIAIDPELGRIAFSSDPGPELLVTWHHGFAGACGGGEYDRAVPPGGEGGLIVNRGESLQPKFDQAANGRTVTITQTGRVDGVTGIRADAGRTVRVAAANGAMPHFRLAGDRPLTGGADSTIELHGLWISGGALRVIAAANSLRRLRLVHCTLAGAIDSGGVADGRVADRAGLVIERPLEVTLDHCVVLGGVRAVPGTQLMLRDSVIDAGAPSRVALAAPDHLRDGGDVTIERCTVIGKLHATSLTCSNSLLLARPQAGDNWAAPVWVDRRQAGCTRFTWLPQASIAPNRFRCLPGENAGPFAARPRFTSLRWGDPGWLQLAAGTDLAIRTGADDEGEPGVWHERALPQRESNLRIRLTEHLPVGMDAAIVHVT